MQERCVAEVEGGMQMVCPYRQAVEWTESSVDPWEKVELRSQELSWAVGTQGGVWMGE